YGLGLNVLGSTGNDHSQVGMPAAASGVLGIGAGTHDGNLCSYTNRGSALDLVAPGCDLDGAWPLNGHPFIGWIGGTSPAAAIASAALALLRSYKPSLAWQVAEHVLLNSADETSQGRVLNIERTFRSVGLGALVDAAKSRAGQRDNPVRQETSAQQLGADPI